MKFFVLNENSIRNLNVGLFLEEMQTSTILLIYLLRLLLKFIIFYSPEMLAYFHYLTEEYL